MVMAGTRRLNLDGGVCPEEMVRRMVHRLRETASVYLVTQPNIVGLSLLPNVVVTLEERLILLLLMLELLLLTHLRDAC